MIASLSLSFLHLLPNASPQIDSLLFPDYYCSIYVFMYAHIYKYDLLGVFLLVVCWYGFRTGRFVLADQFFFDDPVGFIK